ncbi:IPT/TIG domain-containing protein, partial [Pontibacter sp. KCTC 32443]
ITSFSPSSGPVGTEVTIIGTNLNSVAHVNIGSGWIAASSFISASDTQIKVIVPSTASTASLRVTSPYGQFYSSTFTVVGSPTITSFSPSSGPVGTEVTIIGTNLNSVAHVNIGSGWIAASSFISASDTQIKVIVPSTASTASLRVTSPYGQFYSSTFTVVGSPTITSFSPSSGPVGTEVTITGTNLSVATHIYVGNGWVPASSFISASDTQIKMLIPSTASSGSVRVLSNHGQAYSSGIFTVEGGAINITSTELVFNTGSVGSSQVKEYQVSGLGLTNGQAVNIILDAASPFTISTTAGSGFAKSLALNNVSSNRLNATTIFVKYTPVTSGDTPDVITHAQGSISKSLNLRVVTPMPVELKSFTANVKDDLVVLKWSTASEKDNSHFEVEMSAGSLSNFRKISMVKSKVENSSTTTDYTYSHYYSGNGQTEYYRLKQVDLNGASSYSRIIEVKPSLAMKPLVVAPNPLEVDSKAYFSASANGKATLRVTSITGKQVYFEQVDVHVGENALQLSKYSNLMAGVYIVTVEHDGKRESVRIEKK